MNRRMLEKLAVRCLLELEAMNIAVEVVSDVRCVRNAIAPLMSGPGMALDAESLLLTQANSFWVVARHKDVPVLAFGVRVDDLGSEDVQSFIGRSVETIFGVRVTGAVDNLYQGKRWGRAAYFGGFVANRPAGMFREWPQVFFLVAAYAHHCAFVDLGSDVNYSFHRDSDEHKGVRYGFLKRMPFDWATDSDMYPDGNPDWVMHLSREDLPLILSRSKRLFQYRLTKDD